MTDPQQTEADELLELGFALVRGQAVPGEQEQPDVILSGLRDEHEGGGGVTIRARVEPDGNVVYRTEDHVVGSMEDLHELAHARRLLRQVGERHDAFNLNEAIRDVEAFAADDLGLDLDLVPEDDHAEA